MGMHYRKKTLGLLAVSFSLLLFISSAGCMNTLQKTMNASATGKPAGGSGSVISGSQQDTAAAIPDIPPPAPVLPKLTPLRSNITTDVSPILTPDPYPILHGTRINETFQYRFPYRQPEFKKRYHLTGNATGLLVNVVEGPLYIVFVVTPQKDCLVSPESCRGSMTSPVTRPSLKITVRDNQTGEIVAEDGFAREFSSDTGNYLFIITSQNADGSSMTTTSTPGPRYIAIYREGIYHLTIEGNNLDVDLSIITGSSPDPLDAAMQARQGPSSPAAPPPPEEEAWG